MKYDFQKTGPNKAASAEGFTVEAPIAGGVFYEDSLGSLEIDSEWLASPPGIILYAKQRDPTRQARVDKVLPGIINALEFLGHRVEIWKNGPA